MGPTTTRQDGRGSGRNRGGRGGKDGRGGRGGKGGVSKTTDLPKALLDQLGGSAKGGRKVQRPVNTITDRKAKRKEMRQAKRHGEAKAQVDAAPNPRICMTKRKSKLDVSSSKSNLTSKRTDKEVISKDRKTLSGGKSKEKLVEKKERKSLKRNRHEEEDVEDQDLRRLEKKLKIKQPGKLGSGFVDDGLDDLLTGIYVGSSRLNAEEDYGSSDSGSDDDSEDEGSEDEDD